MTPEEIKKKIQEQIQNMRNDGKLITPSNYRDNIKKKCDQNGNDIPDSFDQMSEDEKALLIPLLRRATPDLIAQNIMGVQPMAAPTNMVFGMKSHLKNFYDRIGEIMEEIS